MNARGILIETHAHMPPMLVLDHLEPADADRRIPGGAHSIAELVAHMSFWQEWFCGRCEGIDQAMPEHAAGGWPDVTPGSWTEVRARFGAGLERAAALGDRGDQLLAPPIAFGPLAGYTVRDAIVHMAQHNSHHLGQVILLRQMMGQWPPPSGSWTW